MLQKHEVLFLSKKFIQSLRRENMAFVLEKNPCRHLLHIILQLQKLLQTRRIQVSAASSYVTRCLASSKKHFGKRLLVHCAHQKPVYPAWRGKTHVKKPKVWPEETSKNLAMQTVTYQYISKLHCLVLLLIKAQGQHR